MKPLSLLIIATFSRFHAASVGDFYHLTDEDPFLLSGPQDMYYDYMEPTKCIGQAG